jgi:hypothetical protein
VDTQSSLALPLTHSPTHFPSHDEFFQRNYAYIPILHPGRYLSAFYSPPHMRPPMCLQYVIWALAAYGHEKHDMYHDAFYRRARAYIDIDEMKVRGRLPAVLPFSPARLSPPRRRRGSVSLI